jgi:protein-disulfide isomerase
MTLTRRALMASAAASLALPAFADSTTPATPAPDTVQDISIGAADAKVVIDEFLSFTCPHCANFHNAIYAKLKADYIDTGKVRLVYHEVYFDQYGLLGAMVARCGGEMRYFGITDILYEKQRDWAAAADINAVVDQLKKIGRTAGLEDATIDTCLHDQANAEAMVAHYQAGIAKYFPNDSFSGTPSFLVNGVLNKDIFEKMPYEDLQKILDAELAK